MSDDKEIRVEINDGDKPEPDATTEETVEKTPPQEKEPELSVEEELRQKLATAEDKLLLTLADFENYKKRLSRRQEEFYRTANDGLLSKILEVVDNFERALAHAGEAGSEQGLLDGFKLILKQLTDLLAQYNVTPIEALGQPFDPNLHEALMQVASDEYDQGLCAMEIARGYKAGDRVLRHSKVGVSTGPAKSNDQADENSDNQEAN